MDELKDMLKGRVLEASKETSKYFVFETNPLCEYVFIGATNGNEDVKKSKEGGEVHTIYEDSYTNIAHYGEEDVAKTTEVMVVFSNFMDD